MKFLLAEHGKRFGSALVAAMRAEFYAVDVATDSSAAEQLHYVNPYDLVILDLELPPESGLGLLRLWRDRGVATLVLILDQHSGGAACVESLDAGADDYLARPFTTSEFLARLRALLRRRPVSSSGRLRVADLRMDRAQRRVTVGGRKIDVTPREFALLEYLMARPDEVVSRTELIEHTWDSAFEPMSNVVDVAIHRLRAKIDDGSGNDLLRTVKGAGYVLRSRRASAGPGYSQ